MDFSANINPLGPSPRALEALREALDQLDRYPDPQGFELKEMLSLHHRISPRSLLIGNGSTEIIHLLPRVLKFRRALIPSPTFSEYARACRLSGVAVDYLPLNSQKGFRMSADEVLRRCERHAIDLLFLCNPNNPTGQIMTREELEWLLGRLKGKGTSVIVDEAFMDYQPDQSLCLGFKKGRVPSGLVVLRSLTKFYALAGLRIGYLIADSSWVRRLESAREPWTVNVLAQVAAVESIRDEAHAKKSLEFMILERKRFMKMFSGLAGFQLFPTVTNFALIRILRKHFSQDGFLAYLDSRGILVRDARTFRGLGSNSIRLAIKLPHENDLLFHEIYKFSNTYS